MGELRLRSSTADTGFNPGARLGWIVIHNLAVRVGATGAVVVGMLVAAEAAGASHRDVVAESED